MDPVRLFAEYYRRRHGENEPPESLRGLFAALYEEASR